MSRESAQGFYLRAGKESRDLWLNGKHPKIPEISVGIQMERFASVSPDRNIRDHLRRWSTYFGWNIPDRHDRNSPFHFWQTGSLPLLGVLSNMSNWPFRDYWKYLRKIERHFPVKPGPEGGTPRKIGWGRAVRFSKPLPYLSPKPAIFPTHFMTWPKLRNPICDLTLTSKSCFRPAL